MLQTFDLLLRSSMLQENMILLDVEHKSVFFACLFVFNKIILLSQAKRQYTCKYALAQVFFSPAVILCFDSISLLQTDNFMAY